MDETAHVDEPAPAAPREAPASDAEPTPAAPECAADVSPPVADAPPDAAPEPAEPGPQQAGAEPAPEEAASAAPTTPASTEIEDGAAIVEPPAALAARDELTAAADDTPAATAPVDAPLLEVLEAEPGAEHAPPGEDPAAEPMAEAPPLPVVLVAQPPPEPEGTADEGSRSEAGAVSEPGAEEQQPAESLAAAARTAQEPPGLQPLEEAAETGSGRQNRENGALQPPLAERGGSASHPAPALPAEAGDIPDGLAATVAPETLLTEQAHLREEMHWREDAYRRDGVSTAAQPPPSDSQPAAAGLPAESTPDRQHEPPPPDHEQATAIAPSLPVQTAALHTSAVAAAWTHPVEAGPTWASPERAVPPGPASLPRLLPPEDTAGHPPDLRRALPYVGFVLRAAAIAAAGLIVTTLALAVLYRWVNPPISTLMIGRSLAGSQIERTWVPLERISPNLMRAVILSEDGGFCRHRGVDWAAIEEAIETDRGGSTITMQVVKNLFLWPSRSYVRKAIEIGLAYLVEVLWPKRRILEIYLNIAEWGDGVFGAEAAAETHFGKRAARLTTEEAALLAAVLPNPIERTAGAPTEATGRLASRLAVRMRTSRADFSCVPVPRMEPRAAPPRSPQQRSPQRTPERSLEKPPLVQRQRMTL